MSKREEVLIKCLNDKQQQLEAEETKAAHLQDALKASQTENLMLREILKKIVSNNRDILNEEDIRRILNNNENGA